MIWRLVASLGPSHFDRYYAIFSQDPNGMYNGTKYLERP